MKNKETCIVFNFTLVFLIVGTLIMSGCSSHEVKQSYPSSDEPSVREIKIKTKSENDIHEELIKLQTINPEIFTISTGDRFVLKVYNATELNIPGVIVTPGGNISIGLVGSIHIGGLTVNEANALINEKLSKYVKNPCAVLVPTDVKNASFTILGKVVKPGLYQIKAGYRITDAVAEAKGLLMGERDSDTIEIADLGNAYILRDGKILPVNFIDAIRKGDQLNNIPLADGDFIFVPSALDTQLYVFGEVKMPGTVPYLENQTIIQALAYSKGKIFQTSSNDAIIVRGNLVKPKVYVVNTEDILQGRAPDFKLEPNDIVYVPKGNMTEYNDVIEKILPTVELLNLMAGPFGSSNMAIPITPLFPPSGSGN